MIKRVLAIFILASIFTGCAGRFSMPAIEESDNEAWSVVRGGCAGWAYAGRSTGRAEIIWRSDAKTPLLAPPVAGDGAIFVGTPTRRVLAFDAKTGERIGRMWADVQIEDGLSFCDGLLAITGRGEFNRLRIFNTRDGKFLWDRDADRAGAAPIICGERLFFSTMKGAVFGIDAKTGEKLWRRGFDKAVIRHELAFRDSLLYIADSNGRLFVITADSGIVRWNLDLPSGPVGQPIVIPDHVIVPTASGKIPVITLDGSTRTTIEAPGELLCGLACSGPTVYGVTSMGIVFAGDLGDGGLLWQTNIGEPVLAAPVLWGKQVVVITAEGELNLIFYSDGAIEHTIDLATPVSAPPIIYGANLYIVTEMGEIIAIARPGQSIERENG